VITRGSATSSSATIGRKRLRRDRLAADADSVTWASLLAVVLLSWLGIALAVGTLVGHGIAVGTSSDRD
jgi:hypothetical protein